ncbi:MAG: hypothetical protein NZ526_06220 [Aquificaceae bacterium]|nr:hypothetical protein [Aquificaceae bacterium]
MKENKNNGWKEALSLLHYNEKAETYKKLVVHVSEDDGSVLLVLSEGKKGESQTRLTFSLSRQELIYLAKELELLFMKGKESKP